MKGMATAFKKINSKLPRRISGFEGKAVKAGKGTKSKSPPQSGQAIKNSPQSLESARR